LLYFEVLCRGGGEKEGTTVWHVLEKTVISQARDQASIKGRGVHRGRNTAPMRTLTPSVKQGVPEESITRKEVVGFFVIASCFLRRK